MPRKAANINCSIEQQSELARLASSRTLEARLVDRAKIILLSVKGIQNKDIAQRFGIRPNTVTDIRKRFIKKGLQGLYDKPRSGKPKIYDDDFREEVFKLLETKPPNGHTSWDGPLIAAKLNTSTQAVWRLLRKEGVQLSRKRSWSVHTDPLFVAKSTDIVGLFLNPPLNAIVVSVEEQPAPHAPEQKKGCIKVKNGKIVRAYKNSYKRQGTLNLIAALEITAGRDFGKVTKESKQPDFLTFMEEIVDEPSVNREIHVILDNYCSQKNIEEWLQLHPSVFFHYTPTSTSWLNQIEIWFGIFTSKLLRETNQKSTVRLKNAIESYIDFYHHSPRPFIWKK